MQRLFRKVRNVTVLMIVAAVLAVVNVAAFSAYGIDKRRARLGRWRIPERTLLLLAALGGALGARLGMGVFHHKTQKRRFRILVPLFLVIQLLAFGFYAALVIYTSDSYQPDKTAEAALESSDTVAVTQIRQGWYFDGPGTESALVFYPGGKVEAQAYAELLHALAEGGVDCFLVDMPFNLAFFGVDKAASIQDAYDFDQWYMGGHSLGGVAAASYAAKHMDQLDGIVLLASYSVDDLNGEGFSALSIYGSDDGVLNRSSYDENLANLPDAAVQTVIEGGNHAQFGNYGQQKNDGDAAVSAEEQQRQTVDAILEFVES